MQDRPPFLLSGERARLIPVAADTSKEVRATSVLLAVMRLVPQFSQCMLETVGQRTGVRAVVECFTEPVLKTSGTASKVRPDGYVRLRSGRGREWQALIEAKVGRSELDPQQILAYAEVAKENKIDSIITISNQFVAHPTHAPVQLPKVLARHVSLHHWSWMFIVTQAKLLLNEYPFDNPLEKLILSEMVLYLRHDSVGTSRFDRMNKEWKDLVLAVNAGRVLARSDPEVEGAVAAWQQECRDLTLLMSRNLGRLVTIKLPRAHREDAVQRVNESCELLASAQCLECVLDIPDTASEITLRADLKRRCVTASMTLAAPKDKQRISSRVNWLIRQLAKSDPTLVYVEAKFPGRRPPQQATLGELRREPGAMDVNGSGLLPYSFTVLMVQDLAGKFSGTRAFIEELEKFVPAFYENVGQYLQNYVAKPPKLKDELAESGEPGSRSEVERAAEDAANEAMDQEEEAAILDAPAPAVSVEQNSQGEPM